MWVEPDTYGGRHSPNYGTQDESRYFVPEVDCTYTVLMIFKATMVTRVVSVRGLLWLPQRGQVCDVYASETNLTLRPANSAL